MTARRPGHPLQVKTPFCKPICKPDAAGRTETRETQQTPEDLTPQAGRGQRGDRRPDETAETAVVWLITQRSRVQIPPPLPRPEALSRTENRLLAWLVLTDLRTVADESPL